jgi:hypothetical protein
LSLTCGHSRGRGSKVLALMTAPLLMSRLSTSRKNDAFLLLDLPTYVSRILAEPVGIEELRDDRAVRDASFLKSGPSEVVRTWTPPPKPQTRGRVQRFLGSEFAAQLPHPRIFPLTLDAKNRIKNTNRVLA